MERSFVMVKPDGVQRALVGEVVTRFENRGYKLVASKMLWPSKELLEKHYADLSSQPFFAGLVSYMATGPVVAMVFEGKQAVKMGRVMIGATNPQDAVPGSIRGDYCIDVGRNIIHASDTIENAKREIDLWFTPAEVMTYTSALQGNLYE